ncbi:hypothetical protein BU24DRAFT_340829 [Aaosphaeria arxii CBS 175.79]|uniref:3'-phosphate/5'-hydroxy nucleic acid ligase n=1 Tax=Aaosphaeria arxii CBS 175.79 TaxID=1450172 RepID=A0A6A5Y0F4_9PLEO|nr:uncharacterized protein BU24DRAFT_340829 [Aaosphaeria arxii CBS 175.79]KAF2019018.1 hypothetical protein BU24DRAFT_340829 [Aaosphaeria arxii CBS 175.79]
MPSTRLTLTLNTNRTTKCPLLIPSDLLLPTSSLTPLRNLVLKTATSKLRLKKPTRIFDVLTGKELLTFEDWTTALRDPDNTLAISAGEDFVGVPRKDARDRHPDANPECPVHVLVEDAPVDQLALTQLRTTATTLPGMVAATGQPDLCPGTKYPVGAVFASRGWVHPPLIGGDIGCGMAWYRTGLSRGQVDGEKGRKVAERLRGVEGSWRGREERSAWLRDGEGSCEAGGEWDASVGTIGAGNHFAEIQVVEKGVEGTGMVENEVVLLVHSGSRGYGGSILKRYTAEGRESLKEGSEKMVVYMEEHHRALRWAKANRDLIALRFLSCLEPGEEAWLLGRNTQTDDATTDIETIVRARAKIQERKVVDIWHNNLERVNWPPSLIEDTATSNTGLEAKISEISITKGEARDDYVFVHRKGAAPTYDPEHNLPLPILPLPGSRGTPTLIIKPTFSEETGWGLKNALSLAHGSGRSMSRGKALSYLGSKYKHQSAALLEPGAKEGTWVICDEKELVFEEAPEAYKDVYAVSSDLVREGVAEVVGLCKPRVSYKVRNEAR